MVPASRPFWLTSFYPRGQDPFHCMHSRGGGSIYKSAPHWVRSWSSPNKRVAIEKQAHAMVKTNKLYFSLLSYRRVYTSSTFLLKVYSSISMLSMATILPNYVL